MNKRSGRADKGYGTLYIVSTPIGNLEDITLRALKTLKSVDLIAAESVSHSKQLLRHYGISTRLTGYNQHNRKKKGPELIRGLKSGSDIALVSSAGTPAVSDPGALLINMALAESVNVTPIPGPSAVIAALSVSGLKMDRFLFLGFLSNRSGKRRKELRKVMGESRTMVFYEAPHRIKSMLEDLQEIMGDRDVVIVRELTKMYEEIIRGSVSAILMGMGTGKIKGEITIVVAGKEDAGDKRSLDTMTKKKIERLLKQEKMGVKAIATQLSEEQGLPYRVVYRECLKIKKGND
ncbi:MAG: 16S rRNA (cytidine(1402)-2'-O)-methyltransferase [Deltaproteobacteria bacterium]|nr:16S rRNA (cytidine(1402)-2'-O)-methyltransferase [Deltaproteobacteria bacterium]